MTTSGLLADGALALDGGYRVGGHLVDFGLEREDDGLHALFLGHGGHVVERDVALDDAGGAVVLIDGGDGQAGVLGGERALDLGEGHRAAQGNVHEEAARLRLADGVAGDDRRRLGGVAPVGADGGRAVGRGQFALHLEIALHELVQPVTEVLWQGSCL